MSEYIAYEYHRLMYALSPFDPEGELMRRLNEAGAQGWEMISIQSEIKPQIGQNGFTVEVPVFTAFFKRAYMAQIADR